MDTQAGGSVKGKGADHCKRDEKGGGERKAVVGSKKSEAVCKGL